MPSKELTDRRRSEIVHSAYEVFARKGYHDTNIADIAQDLGIGHGTFYRYFENKLDIFAHVVDRAIAQVREIVADEDPRSSNTLAQYRDQVARIADRLAELFLNDESLPQLLFVEAAGIEEGITARVQGAMDLFGAFTEAYLRNGRDKGFLRADLDTEVTALAINAMIFECARRVPAAADRETQKDRWIRSVITLMFEGTATQVRA